MTDRTPRQAAKIRWRNMIRRCTNPNDVAWHNYGGRGIEVCPRWLNFEDYYEDTGDCPSPELSLDRIDNDGPYAPGNVRWATAKEQIDNRRPLKRHTHCRRGHELTPENTYYYNAGWQRCRECKRALALAARKAAAA